MLDFKTIELSDKPRADRCLALSGFRGCEYCFGNNMAWRRLYDTKIAFYKDFYISCSRLQKGSPTFTFPAGKGSYREVFSEMKVLSDSMNAPFSVSSVTEEQLPLFGELFGEDSFTVDTDEGGWDYIYRRSDLAELRGKKYHGKRNHLKKLTSENISFEPLTEKDFDDCITYAANFYSRSDAYDDFSKVCEQFAINTYFENFSALGLFGGVLRLEGRLIAFTLGERICTDTFGVHIEKAEADIEGAYPAINKLFSETVDSGCMYLNREEDLGLEGLRKAKRSYYPAFMLKKYKVTLK